MKRSAAFTLVELAIVLVIIGLLIGGVLQGQELIRQAKMNRLATELRDISVSIRVFQTKYNAIPSDMKNAGAMFASASCPVGAAALGCDGNGDGKISSGFTDGTERYRFWQHLYLAGLSKFHSTGVVASGPGAKVGENMYPSTAFEGIGFNASYFYTPFLTTVENNKNIMFVGTNNPVSDYTYPIHNGAFSQQFMKEYDIKFDDGKPGLGLILAGKGYGGALDCYSGTELSVSAVYYANATDSGQVCAMNILGMIN